MINSEFGFIFVTFKQLEQRYKKDIYTSQLVSKNLIHKQKIN